MRCRDDNFIQRFFTVHDVAEVERGRATQGQLGIGQSKVSIKQHDSPATHCQRRGKIGCDSRFADAAFAAGDADYVMNSW